MALEATVAEVIMHSPRHHLGSTSALLKSLLKKNGTLVRYEVVLKHLGKPKISRGTYQDAEPLYTHVTC